MSDDPMSDEFLILQVIRVTLKDYCRRTEFQGEKMSTSEEEYANDDDDDQMDSWSEGTSPLPCDASHTSDEALPIKQFVRLQYSSDRVFRVLWQTRAAMQTRSAV